jgi:predicted amidohydrolase YtcJ
VHAPGTLILRRARVHSTGRGGPVSALAIRDGRVVCAGSDVDVWSAVGSDAPSVDLGGRVVLPGLTDAHVHWCSYALMRRGLALAPAMSLGEVLREVRTAVSAAAPGTWVVGRGWDHTGWGAWPTAADLDTVAPSHPVALTRKDGHVVWLNSAALVASGITLGTPDPPGGEIARASGHPTGILKENAVALITAAIPPPDSEVRQAAMVDAWRDAWSRGLTGCHDMGFGDTALFLDLSTLRDAGELGLRFVWYFPLCQLDQAIGLGLRSGMGDEWLRVGGMKLYLDGTLGSQTAHMHAAYAGQAGNTGLPTMTADEFTAHVRRADVAGLATAVHAIGDAATRVALDGFAAVVRERARGIPDLVHRVEHAQVVDPSDIPRFARLGVTASMQPVHATSDRLVAQRLWGDRCQYGYAWRSFLDAGTPLAFGSDAPIESLDPFAGLHAAVTRCSPTGEPPDGWHPEQRITLHEALTAYTRGPALASGQGEHLGSLDPGMCADLIVLERDPYAVGRQALLDVSVLATMIDGVWVWQSPAVDFAGPRPIG